MPIWLRKFTFFEMQKWYDEEKSSINNQNSSNQTNMINPDGSINTPEFLKASKPYKGKSSYK